MSKNEDIFRKFDQITLDAELRILMAQILGDFKAEKLSLAETIDVLMQMREQALRDPQQPIPPASPN